MSETDKIEFGKERAAEILVFFYIFGSEFWALSTWHYRILRICQVMASLEGARNPDVEMVNLFNKKFSDTFDPVRLEKGYHDFMACYSHEEMIEKVKWFVPLCDMLGFEPKTLRFCVPIDKNRK